MLSKFKDIHEGEIGIVIGNGPSLKDCPRELLDKYISFGSNKIFLLDGFVPNYYTIIDEHMLHNCAPYLVDGKYKPDAMFIRRPYPISGCYHINCIVHAGWSYNINKAVVMGGTVTYASLQIAHYMGIRTALLVGVDHDYSGGLAGAPSGAIFQADLDVDPDHFHPEYFKVGEFYAAPELEGSEQYYYIARTVYEKDEGRVINLTPNTKERVLEKGEYKDWL